MPQADNTHHLRAATKRRATEARQRTTAAIERLADAGAAITPTTVARAAGVSRQWLYTCPDALDAIRGAQTSPDRRTPVRRQASTASQQRRIEALHDDNNRLRAEVANLEQRLAAAYGELRASRAGGPTYVSPS